MISTWNMQGASFLLAWAPEMKVKKLENEPKRESCWWKRNQRRGCRTRAHAMLTKTRQNPSDANLGMFTMMVVSWSEDFIAANRRHAARRLCYVKIYLVETLMSVLVRNVVSDTSTCMSGVGRRSLIGPRNETSRQPVRSPEVQSHVVRNTLFL